MKPFRLWAVVTKRGALHDVYLRRENAERWAISLTGQHFVVGGTFVPDKKKVKP